MGDDSKARTLADGATLYRQRRSRPAPTEGEITALVEEITASGLAYGRALARARGGDQTAAAAVQRVDAARRQQAHDPDRASIESGAGNDGTDITFGGGAA